MSSSLVYLRFRVLSLSVSTCFVFLHWNIHSELLFPKQLVSALHCNFSLICLFSGDLLLKSSPGTPRQWLLTLAHWYFEWTEANHDSFFFVSPVKSTRKLHGGFERNLSPMCTFSLIKCAWAVSSNFKWMLEKIHKEFWRNRKASSQCMETEEQERERKRKLN